MASRNGCRCVVVRGVPGPDPSGTWRGCMTVFLHDVVWTARVQSFIHFLGEGSGCVCFLKLRYTLASVRDG